ncbi:hypothetical protein B9Z51_00215 [Limnohabitans sp. T6-5]|nr:hypothetical protein B9Z51_00215 [Limnohabitans sp. T6-5]
MLQFMADLELSLKEAQTGTDARVTTGEEIKRRTRGRPVAKVHKQPVTLRLDADVLERWRASGKGWQTRMSDALRDWLRTHSPV